MKILFLGYAVSATEADFLCGASVAGNKMQLSIIKELAKYSDISLYSITVYPAAPYPHNHLFIRRDRIVLDKELISDRIGFLNLPLIKQVNQMLSTFFSAKRMADEDTLIMTFNAFPQVGIPALWLKRSLHCKICCLLPDPPVDISNEGTLKKLFNRLARKVIKNCDSLIVLNEEAIRRYAKPNTPYIVVEGGADGSKITPPQIPQREHTERNLLYCGALTSYSGILELVFAMGKLKSRGISLDIYGSGSLEDEIKNMAKENKNIRFHGKILNAEVMQKQREAWLLVNPRRIDDPISQVTFPSKMFEYMTSGTPVLSTKLNGLTDAFLEHLFVAEDSSPDKLAEAIDYIAGLSEEELREKADGAYHFIIEQKNWAVQCEKVVGFISDITKKRN